MSRNPDGAVAVLEGLEHTLQKDWRLTMKPIYRSYAEPSGSDQGVANESPSPKLYCVNALGHCIQHNGSVCERGVVRNAPANVERFLGEGWKRGSQLIAHRISLAITSTCRRSHIGFQMLAMATSGHDRC